MSNYWTEDEHATAFWYATTAKTGAMAPAKCQSRYGSHTWVVTKRIFYCKRCHVSIYEAEVLGHIKYEVQ